MLTSAFFMELNGKKHAHHHQISKYCFFCFLKHSLSTGRLNAQELFFCCRLVLLAVEVLIPDVIAHATVVHTLYCTPDQNEHLAL